MVLKEIQFYGKSLLDCTDLFGAGISHGLNIIKSGSQGVKELATDAKVVKAISNYGFKNFMDGSFPKFNVKPTLLIFGNFKDVKNRYQINRRIGCFVKDAGNLS